MTIKKSTLRNIYITFIAIIIIGFIFILSNKKEEQIIPNSEVVTTEDGKQIIDLTAKGGYSPRIIEAKANTETILRVTTNNTFDCSSAFTIPELNVRKNLPVTGKTDIEIAAQEVGKVIKGTCSMGMYNFEIKFI